MRCAIYTRKSTDDARDSQLKSVDNQRDLCAKYIESQAAEGWSLLPDRYDDEGFGGGNMKRPALERLMADVRTGAVDAIVVYKIDRLSRSLRDFANIIDAFDRAGVSFYSTTQQFSTTTSMGRLTLNILLTFAQFEREMIGERTRDWVAGAKARGIWTSGPPPYGYRLENKRLAVHDERAEVVRFIFRRFARLGVFADVAEEVNCQGHRNRRGARFDGRLIKAVLTNRTYLGESPHHPRIVTKAAWMKAQEAIAAHEASWRSQAGARSRRE